MFATVHRSNSDTYDGCYASHNRHTNQPIGTDPDSKGIEREENILRTYLLINVALFTALFCNVVSAERISWTTHAVSHTFLSLKVTGRSPPLSFLRVKAANKNMTRPQDSTSVFTVESQQSENL